MATQVPFEAGDCLISRPKVDRWVDSTQCDYGQHLSCWQVLSEVELRRIFDVYKRWANSGFECICKEKYGPIYEATRAIRSLFMWKFSTYLWPRPVDLDRAILLHFHTCSARNAVLASCIEKYYFLFKIVIME